jgi:uncharacterized protein YfaS (alpha-2-macroglobulin family)
MKEGLDYLTHYPYECTEQIISKFIPNILTMKTIKALSLEDKSLESNLKLQINTAYQRLSKLQNPDGGWGWWGNQSSDPLTSAYVIFGLIEAKEQGFYANDELISNGVNYLKNNLKALHALTEPLKRIARLSYCTFYQKPAIHNPVMSLNYMQHEKI